MLQIRSSQYNICKKINTKWRKSLFIYPYSFAYKNELKLNIVDDTN